MTTERPPRMIRSQKWRTALKDAFAAGDKCLKDEISVEEFDKIWNDTLNEHIL